MLKCELYITKFIPFGTMERNLYRICFALRDGKYGDPQSPAFNLEKLVKDILHEMPEHYKTMTDTKPSGYTWVGGRKCLVNEMRFRYCTLAFYLPCDCKRW